MATTDSPYLTPKKRPLSSNKKKIANTEETLQSKNGFEGYSKVSFEEALALLNLQTIHELSLEDEFPPPSEIEITAKDLEELEKMLNLTTDSVIPRFKYYSEAFRQKLMSDIIKFLLPRFPNLKLQGERFFRNDTDKQQDRSMLFPISAAKEPWLIPIVALVEVKRMFQDSLGQVLAMVKGIDSFNLSNGYNIPNYYCIITDLTIWEFVKITTEGGYTVFTSDQLFWGGKPATPNKTILGYVLQWLARASKVAENTPKGLPQTTYTARGLKDDFILWTAEELSAYVAQHPKLKEYGYDKLILEEDIMGETLSQVIVTPEALEAVGLKLKKKGHLSLFYNLKAELNARRKAFLKRTQAIQKEISEKFELPPATLE